MKTLVIIITILFMFSVNGYSQKTDVQKLLENKENRTELFNAMVNSHEYMTDFISVAKNNDHAMMMMNDNNMMGQHQMGMNQNQDEMHGNHQMMGDNNGMGMMMNNPEQMQKMMEHMMYMCDQDSTLRSKMSGIILNHPKMMEMMKNHGMMNMHGSVSGNKMEQMHAMKNSNSKRHQHK